MIRRTISALRNAVARARLPPAAKAEERRDREGLGDDPGIQATTAAAIEWLLHAQDSSLSRDGGVARHYSLINGWAVSYPETTGYIVPTLIAWGLRHGDAKVLDAARRMVDWLLSIQFPNGGFQGGVVDSRPLVPVTFNTGQILLGLASAASQWGDPYLAAMNRAAKWLVDTQDSDGCWRLHPTPFAMPGEKAYETHVGWGLFEAARVESGNGYAESALANVRWALGLQRQNGWVEKCCLTDPSAPLTHTLGYFLRGVMEAHGFRPEPFLLEAAQRTADGLIESIGDDGFLAGRLDEHWKGAVPWVCLTGSSQIAHSLLMLFRETGQVRYRDSAFALNCFVRRSVRIDGHADTRGAVKGSFPVAGDYGAFEFLNWAAKFFIDANVLEAEIRGSM
jgi:hypothetical protein